MASPGAGTADPPPAGRLRLALLNAPARWLVAGIAAVAILVSGAFGGFDKAAPDGPPKFTVGQPYAAGGWTVTVHGVRALDELPPLRHKENSGWRWIVVVATVEVTDAGESTLFHTQALQIHGVKGAPAKYADHVAGAADAAENAAVQPGVPARFGYFWEQRAEAPVPTELQVDIFALTYTFDNASNKGVWLPAKEQPAAVAMVPIDTKPAS
ncbi:hypothetical protein ABT369_31390 [Dactylosporangium sp. NPDC000244]|uniref:hypothetical protein n=1 Tax=Dactylosporangium sp. NPDC000244 TaxID=3154365 RepID=UPI003316F694